MSITDIFLLLQWWAVFLVFGLLFFPLTSRLLYLFPDKGYLFAKVIGIVGVSYCIFVLGIIHLIPFSQFSAVTIALGIALLVFFTNRSFLTRKTIPWKLILIEEIIFFLSLYFWSYIRIHQPDIYGLEKYMDFGFVNAILRSSYFPPKDMWFTPFSINYYYFGHLVTAVLTKISGIPSAITYNLMLATLFAFAFSLSFSLSFTIITTLQKMVKQVPGKSGLFAFFASLLTAALVSLGGNLHVVYIFFTQYKNENPVPFTELLFALQTIPNGYWYPNATRFIYNTIHEFPIYSFVVSDLHGHVLDIPIVLTILALLLQLFLSKKLHVVFLLFLSFMLSTAYMTNAWDGGIYLLLSCLIIFSIHIASIISKEKKITIKNTFTACIKRSSLITLLYYCMILIAGFFFFSLPFSLFFKTGAIVHGIGVVCPPEFLQKIQHIGPFLFEADHCQRSPLWQLFILYGFFYFFVWTFLFFLYRTKKLFQTDIFVLLLISIATFLIIIPEFFYMKDIYPAHYRANTMFKLTYEAFILLSIVSGYIIVRIVSSLLYVKTLSGKVIILIFITITTSIVSLVLFYPTLAINSYYGDLKTVKTLDGTTYLQTLHPDDYAAIQWINTNITEQPVIAEAQGDSYTDFGRISTNTGLPTILGWTVHEWLWRGSYDIPSPRISEIQTLYETKDTKTAKALIDRYDVSYVYVGDLERQKYKNLSDKKFKSLGNVVYQKGNTKIYKVR